MFRVSQYMRVLASPEPPPRMGPLRAPPGPVVIWNLIRRCNLTCKHCYSVSADRDFPNELSPNEIEDVMDDLRRYGVPVLILSGGEPLMHPHVFRISRRAKAMGFYVGLSTNGTRIDDSNISRIADVGYDYVGISIDGMRETHDRFRRLNGAFDLALRGVRLCRGAGIKVGLRFTLTEDNSGEFPDILRLMDEENIDKLYLSHLNYAGRGNRNRRSDARHAVTRRAMNLLFETCLRDVSEGREREYVTGNNDADAVYLLEWAKSRFPDRLPALRERLVRWGGNASGIWIANIDNEGRVHPDTFWWHHTLGNVRRRPFSRIWEDLSDPVMAGLKRRPRPVEGRCGACAHLDVCGGNTRVRAYQISGNLWAEDPGCYLTDREIGVAPQAEARYEGRASRPVAFRPRSANERSRRVRTEVS
ncbi:MAG TPA: heme d1 biosynthesis radical SAM protein NirJ [Gammaproteobacteria bacterium]|nr:heme d1 biosynthesis radical SAM protein NirJ [Gammaproteobacteria bacterium]